MDVARRLVQAATRQEQKVATRERLVNAAMALFARQGIVQTTTADIAKSRGLTMVLNKAMVVLNAQNYDITKEALQMLDTRLTTVKLPPPQ